MPWRPRSDPPRPASSAHTPRSPVAPGDPGDSSGSTCPTPSGRELQQTRLARSRAIRRRLRERSRFPMDSASKPRRSAPGTFSESQADTEISALALRVGDPDDDLLALAQRTLEQRRAGIVARAGFHGNRIWPTLLADEPHRRGPVRRDALAPGGAIRRRSGILGPEPQ